MDNVTHALLGVAVGLVRRRDGGPEHDAPLSPTDKAVTWATLVAAELPDMDVFFGGSSPMDEYRYHRGWTHALVLSPVMALAAALAVKLFFRQARLGTVYAWSLLSVLVAHLANDWFTGWGTRLLLPFSDARIGLDWVPIVDLLYTLPLLAAAIIAWKKPGLRRRAAVSVLTYLVVYAVGYRGAAHTLVNQAVARHYEGAPVAQMRVAPNLFNPLAWQFTVDLGDRFETGSAYPFGTIAPSQVIVRQPEDEVIRAVRSAPVLKPFFDQFPFALITYQPREGGYEATIGDVRYQAAGRGMSYTVQLDQGLRVVAVQGSGW